MQRRGVALAVAVLALSPLLASPAAGAQPTPEPSISLSPSCGAVDADNQIEVTGSGFFGGPDVEIFFNGVEVGLADAGSSGSFTETVTVVPPAGGWYHVEARGENFDFARAGFRSPCTLRPSVRLTPSCGPTARVQLTVEGFDFPPNNDSLVVFDSTGSTRREISSASDNSGYVTETFFVAPTEERNYVVEVNDYGVYGAAARAVYVVPCPPATTTTAATTTSPTTAPSTTTTATTTTTTVPPATPGAVLVVSPPLGPPGFVTIARGSGFEPGPVALTWSPGLGTTSAVAGDDGTFTVQVLVLPNDRLGPRTLVASGTVSVATASFLVVPNTMKPAGRDVLQIVGSRRYLHR
jgi:hypothetical protein